MSSENAINSVANTDERLTEEEALLYQELATKGSSTRFSEQASPESYEIAKQLIDKLKGNGFDFLALDWDHIDLLDPISIQNTEERLRHVAQMLADSENGSLPEAKRTRFAEFGAKFQRGFAGLVSALALFVTLTSTEANAAGNFIAQNEPSSGEQVGREGGAEILPKSIRSYLGNTFPTADFSKLMVAKVVSNGSVLYIFNDRDTRGFGFSVVAPNGNQIRITGVSIGSDGQATILTHSKEGFLQESDLGQPKAASPIHIRP